MKYYHFQQFEQSCKSLEDSLGPITASQQWDRWAFVLLVTVDIWVETKNHMSRISKRNSYTVGKFTSSERCISCVAHQWLGRSRVEGLGGDKNIQRKDGGKNLMGVGANCEDLRVCISFLWLCNKLPQTKRLRTRQMYYLITSAG